MKLLANVLLAFPLIATAQTDFKGEWSFPTSVKHRCLDVEQKMMAAMKEMVTQNRLGFASTNPEERKTYFQTATAFKESMENDEKTWERLGCAHILYPKK